MGCNIRINEILSTIFHPFKKNDKFKSLSLLNTTFDKYTFVLSISPNRV